MTRAAGKPSNLVYVIPHFASDESDHFAHIPALLAELGERVDLAAVVERGTAPARLGGVRLLLQVPGRTKAGRFVGTLRTVVSCSAAGYDTYFLRYSRLFLVGLIVTYPLFRHRVLLWRSGISNVIEPERRGSLRPRLDDAVNRLLLRFVHRLVTGPESMVDYMARQWDVPRAKICLLYNDIDADRFTPLPPAERARTRARLGWRDEEFVILFVHRLAYRKGVRLLGPILRALLHEDVPVRLVVAGDGPDRGRVEQAAADPRCQGRMDVLGAVPNRELPELYGAADCFLTPSHEEGFPRVLLEAMATALPVVTTDAGGSRDVIGTDYPYVAGVGDLDGLVRHLLSVIRLPAAERQALGDRLRARAQAEFSPRRVAGMLEDLL
ncbi:MAG: glycosyltransferase family 4 protein [Actinomadura sp.]